MALTVVAVALVIGVLNLLDGFPLTLIIVGASAPALLLVFWMIHLRMIEAANFMLLILLLIVLTIIISLENGIHDVGIILYPVIAILAGALIGRRGLVIFLGLVTMSVFVVVLGEVYGFLPRIHPPGPAWISDAVVVSLIMLIAAIAIRLLMEAQERALARTRASEEELTDKVRKLQLLREISLLYARELDLRTLVKRIYEVFPRFFPSTTANVLVYSAEAGGLISDDQLGIDRRGVPPSGGVTMPGESISGRAFLERRPINIDDCTQTDIIPREWIDRLHLRSCLAVPIIAQDAALGVLRLDHSEQKGAFSDEDVTFFEMLADQLAIGIQNQRLFEERQRSQAALAEGESRFRMLSENVSDVIWTSDLQLHFRYISDSVQRLFGWTPGEWLQLEPEAYLLPESLEMVRNTISKELSLNGRAGVDPNRVVVVEILQRRKDGSTRWTEVVARFLWGGRPEPEGIIGVTRDISQRKQAEQEVRRLNAELERRVRERTSQLERVNQELEAFSYSVSHDLRAPIRHILGYLRLLETELRGHVAGEAARLLRTIEQSAQRMAQLIDDLLRLSRLSRTDMRAVPTDLTYLVTMLWTRLSSGEPHRSINFEAHPTSIVTVDPGLIEVALENLLSNARKFTTKTSSPRVEFGQMTGEDGPIFYVRDNGAGFEMAYAKKLFGVFQRLHDSEEFPGTGIGLATVSRILERHGGRIWAEAEVDRGATFYFTVASA
jgi:PAS domain S-box-containing protein